LPTHRLGRRSTTNQHHLVTSQARMIIVIRTGVEVGVEVEVEVEVGVQCKSIGG
jgi:hypothetical protein